MEHATVKDVFFIPEVHFAEEKPISADDDGWWYQVRSVIWCRTCRKCRVRKETEGFTSEEWRKKRPAICIECDGTKGVTRVSSKKTKSTRSRVKHPSNPPARRPRAAQGKGGAIKACCKLESFITTDRQRGCVAQAASAAVQRRLLSPVPLSLALQLQEPRTPRLWSAYPAAGGRVHGNSSIVAVHKARMPSRTHPSTLRSPLPPFLLSFLPPLLLFPLFGP